jgi:hypothetical protein
MLRAHRGGLETPQEALEALDAAFASGERNRILQEIPKAVNACREVAPELFERLKQHITVRAAYEDLEEDRVERALGEPSLKNAYFWLLFARLTEDPGEPCAIGTASMWEQFRVHAVYEGWFRAEGPEAAALYLHIADLLRRIPRERLPEMRKEFEAEFTGYAPLYDDQPLAVRAAIAGHNEADRYYLYPDQLYERACAIDPPPDTFEQWIKWAKGERHGKALERAAAAWCAALPNDPRPLLHLMDYARRRGALQKAIAFLEEAEGLNAFCPEVRRGRLRLLAASLLHHLRRRQFRLAERDLAAMESLPQAREGDWPAALAILRWVCSQLRGDRAGAVQHLAEASQILDNRRAATFLCARLAHRSGLSNETLGLPEDFPVEPDASLSGIVARVHAIADDLDVPVDLELRPSPDLLDVAARSRDEHVDEALDFDALMSEFERVLGTLGRRKRKPRAGSRKRKRTRAQRTLF